MNRVYTRGARALANAMLIVGAYITAQFLYGQAAWVFVVVALFVIAPGFIYYGYFLSSQHCSNCGEQIFRFRDLYPVIKLVALVLPFHVPKRCPHCEIGRASCRARV